MLPARGLGSLSTDFFGTGIAIVTIQGSLIVLTDWLSNLLVSAMEIGEDDGGIWSLLDLDKCLDRFQG